MRYWTLGLVGVALSAAAVAVVAWCTYALTRISVCTPDDTSFACERDAGQLGIALAVALVVAIPVGSKLHARRKRPRGAPIGPLAIGLALACAGGAALWSALGTASGTTAATIGFALAVPLLCVGLTAVLGGLSVAGRRGDELAARLATAKERDEPADARATIAANLGVPTGADDALGRKPAPRRDAG